MAANVLIVPDKFKGTLTAPDAAAAIARGWLSARPQDSLDQLPMSDGGDGFGQIISQLLKAEPQIVSTVDAAHRPRHALWWWHAPSRTAIVESAQVIGLAILPPGHFHPFQLDTHGLGPVLQAAADHGARRCLMGIGGSSTNDGGFGLARALGWRFLDAAGGEIQNWTDLHQLHSLTTPQAKLLFDELIVAVDVQNILLGPTGCTRVYGPQKGLLPGDFEMAEQCLENLAKTVSRDSTNDISTEPGTGAAGGLGFGLRAFAGARLQPGFDLFAALAHLRDRMEKAQLVITGEGAIDESSLMGKGVGEVARMAQELRVPCLGLGGIIAESARASGRFARVQALAPDLTSAAEAQAHAAGWLEKLAAKVAASWSPA